MRGRGLVAAGGGGGGGVVRGVAGKAARLGGGWGGGPAGGWGGSGGGGGGGGAAVPALLAGIRATVALGLVAPAEQLLCVSADRVGEVRSDRCGRVVVGVGRREAVRRRLSAGVVRSLVRASA